MVSTVNRRASVEHLRGIAEFRDCTRRQLEQVARLAERVSVAPGEVLTREGRIGREFFLILTGTVEVTRNGHHRRALGPGDYFGELAAVNPGPRNATVTATSELDVLIIGPRELATMFEIPGFRDSLLHSMAGRLRAADADLEAALEAPDPAP
jgi:CRP-like cAMP-binding protein